MAVRNIHGKDKNNTEKSITLYPIAGKAVRSQFGGYTGAATGEGVGAGVVVAVCLGTSKRKIVRDDG